MTETKHSTPVWLGILSVTVTACAFLIYRLIPADDANIYVFILLIIPIIFFGIAFFNQQDNTLSKNKYRFFAIISIIYYIITINFSETKFGFFLVELYIFIVLFFITFMIKDLLIRKLQDDTFDILFYILAIILLTNNILCIGFVSNDSYLRKNQEGGKIGIYINPSSSIENYSKNEVSSKLSDENDILYNNILNTLKKYPEKKGNSRFIKTSLSDIVLGDKKKEFLNEIIEKLIKKDNSEKFNVLISDILNYALNEKYKDSSGNKFLENIGLMISELKYSFSIDDGIIDDDEYEMSNDILKMYLYNNEEYIIVNFEESSSYPIIEPSNSIKRAGESIKVLSQYSKITVTLVSHTNGKTKNGSDFSSNQELSQARAIQVENKINNEINNSRISSAIKWSHLPLTHNEKDDFINQTSVNINIEPELKNSYTSPDSHPKKPTFLEYMYFTYSLLGTGYGDMFPVSPEAKFLCSIANFLELYFLVIFLNIFLIEASRELKKNGSSTSETIQKESSPKKTVSIVNDQTKH